MINCIAIDDEPLALDIIAEYCNKIPFLKLVKTFDNALDVIEYLKNEDIDLMFLDIQMEGLTGIQLLGVLSTRPKVVLTTAYERFALKGYELDVSDYLLKPISFDRFTKSVSKAYEAINLERNAKKNESKIEVTNVDANENYFFVKADSRLVKIKFDSILYIEGQGDYLSVVTINGKILTLQNFSNISKNLPADNFLRIHKSYIISFDKIEKVEKHRVYINGTGIPVSDTYKNALFSKIKEKEV